MIADETTEQRRSRRGVTLDAVGWALFFIWIGVVMLVKGIPNGVGAIGIAAIILGGSIARILLRVTVSTFWLLIGSVFLLAGIGELAAIDLPLLPVALIVCGVLLLLHQKTKRHGRR